MNQRYVLFSSKSDDYMNKALDIAGVKIVDNVVARIALALMEMEMENKNQLKLKEMEMENKNQLELKEAYYLGLLADLTQRELIEKFFNRIVSYYRAGNELIVKAVEELEPRLRKKFIDNCKNEYPTMTTINSALTSSDKLRKAVWELIGLTEDVKWPNFKNDLLYPILSSTAHVVGLKKVYLQSDLDPTLKKFYENVAAIYNQDTSVVDAERVALAKDILVEK